LLKCESIAEETTARLLIVAFGGLGLMDPDSGNMECDGRRGHFCWLFSV